MATPPKTRRKINPEARAEIGLPRECDTCGEIKEVTNKTYALSKKGKRGWHTTCRVCQGVAKGEKGAKVKDIVKLPVREGHEYNTLIEEMYRLGETNRNPARIEEIAQELRDQVFALADAGDERGSLRLFVQIVQPLVAGWMEPGAIHDDIIDGLLSHDRRRLIIATRYSAKSTLTAIYIAWRIMLDPLVKVMVISKGAKLAARMIRTVRRVFFQNCPMLAHLVPTEDCLDNAEQFQTPASLKVTTGGATMSSFGVTSDLPGYRADITIGDDVEGPSDDTPEKVMELEEKLNEIHMINPIGEKIMLGTYQSEFSVYAVLADKVGGDGEPVWELHRCCMFEEDPDGKEIRSRWPAMFSDADAMDWRKSVTARAWKLHAMLIADPSILNERPLKIGDLILLNASALAREFPLIIQRTQTPAPDMPTWGAPKGDVWRYGQTSGESTTYVQTVVAVDPASGLAGRDAIGVAVISITGSGYAVIRHLEGVRGPSKAHNMRRLASICRDFAGTDLVVEETEESFFGSTLEAELVLVGHPMTVNKAKHGGMKKGQRIIDALAPTMGAGRIIMLESVARSDHGGEFVTQLTKVSYDGRTGKAKDHDDIVDALAHAVNVVRGSLLSDPADNVATHRASRLDRFRGVSLRQGGLGVDHSETSMSRKQAGRNVGSGVRGQPTMGEALIAEDTVLIKLIARRDALSEVIQEDARMGKSADLYIVKKVRSLTNQINELKELVVL
jgi:hypothetical protein